MKIPNDELVRRFEESEEMVAECKAQLSEARAAHRYAKSMLLARGLKLPESDANERTDDTSS